jgi:DNA ligase-1
MSNRELLMLAHKFEPDKHNPAGMYVSLKLDGTRCLWDGGVTRGLPKIMVPWANQDKDGRYTDPPVCTGLWSRYGNIIHAPSWFLDQLPSGVMLDGELWSGRGNFQESRSTVATLVPDNERWRKITYNIFDIPPITELFKEGKINNPNFKKEIVPAKCLSMLKDTEIGLTYNKATVFENVYRKMVELWQNCGKPKLWKPLTQIQLSEVRADAVAKLATLLDEETEKEGEGLMLRTAWSYWTPVRSKYLLKVKKLDDDEGVVIGCMTGKEGKLLGLMGALIVKLQNGKTFELSGFTEHERQLILTDGQDTLSRLREARAWAEKNPGVRCPSGIVPVQFGIGKVITFKHRGVTDDGLPREARYWRFK